MSPNHVDYYIVPYKSVNMYMYTHIIIIYTIIISFFSLILNIPWDYSNYFDLLKVYIHVYSEK